tara:strand:+ start:269 stop:472 length:204 start_codon:yes stop_codon:yes gene_type:complete
MTYGEYKPTWLKQKISVDIYGRELNLSDVPMTMMVREDAFKKRRYTVDVIDDIYEKWILEQEAKENG